MGRVEVARQLLAEWGDRYGRDDLEYVTNVGRAAGSIALAEGDADSAVTAFLEWHSAPHVTAVHIYHRGLTEAANAHDRAGRAEAAIELYERALATPSALGLSYEVTWYPHTLRRLGELHESLGHRGEAVEYYNQFIDLWKDADEILQPQVDAAREAVARLTGERGVKNPSAH